MSAFIKHLIQGDVRAAVAQSVGTWLGNLSVQVLIVPKTECGLVAGEVPVPLLSTAKVPLSKQGTKPPTHITEFTLRINKNIVFLCLCNKYSTLLRFNGGA